MSVLVINPEDKKEYLIEANKNGENTIKCPVCSETRKKKSIKSLSYNLQKGAGKCHHCGVVLVEKKDKPLMLEKTEYKRPTFVNRTDLSDALIKWFSGRKITQTTLLKFKVTEGEEFLPQVGAKRNCIHFNYFRDGELINVKYRDGKKNFKLVKGAELIFYNLDAVKDADEIIIVEGEMDCLAMSEAGFDNCISVPNGATLGKNNLAYLDNCVDLFKQDTKFILALDNDLAGNNLREELARRLGFENCFKVNFGDCKDANDCLIKYGTIGIKEAIKEKKEFPIIGVFKASDIKDEIYDYYNNGLPHGYGTGMREFDDLIKFHPGYMTVITGIPGDGKSEFLDFISAKLNIEHGWKFAMYSPENHPLQLHFSKFAEKFIGKSWQGQDRLNLIELKQAERHFEDNFYFINPEDDFTLDSILATVRQLIRRRGVNAFVIDAWNKLDHQYTANETKYISEQLDKITKFCERNQVHCFLVAHPTKMQKDKNTGLFEVPNLYSINGSANFFNKTANGICVYRDRTNPYTTEIYIQKVKFKHWGQTGLVTVAWDRINGRYYKGSPDYDNWISKIQVQSEIQTIENNNEFLNQSSANQNLGNQESDVASIITGDPDDAPF